MVEGQAAALLRCALGNADTLGLDDRQMAAQRVYTGAMCPRADWFLR